MTERQLDLELLERGAHMRDTALGRVQAASELSRVAGELLTDAMRAYAAAGGELENLALEAGLDLRTVRAIVKGRRAA